MNTGDEENFVKPSWFCSNMARISLAYNLLLSNILL